MDTKITTHGLGLLAAFLTAGIGLAGEPMTMSLADRLLAENGKIRSVRCEIRREVEVEGGTLQSLSRVWFERPDKLRVETVTPEARRIVADGTAIYKWLEGQTAGVRIPIDGAPEVELNQLRKTPGTADEHLMRLKGLPETELTPLPDFPLRRGYAAPSPHPFTVLSLDATGRLARLEFFDSPSCTNRLLVVSYAGWKEAKPGIWMACLQKAQAKGRDGMEVSETLRVNGLEVNESIDPGEFVAARQAAAVKFLSPLDAEKAIKK
jgi:hypothetical protein